MARRFERALGIGQGVLMRRGMWWKETPRIKRVAPEKVRGSLLAGALADGFGFRHEGKAPGPVRLELGPVSDDTQLTLATCEGLLQTDGVVRAEAIAARFVAWHREYGIVGAGAASAKALQELSIGGHWALVGRRGEMAAGNGAAIRIAPLAFVQECGERAGRLRLRDVARITHHNEEAYAGALALALGVESALAGWNGRARFFEALIDQLPDTRIRDRLVQIAASEASVAILGAHFGTGAYVVESVPLALHAYARAAESDDLLALVQGIVNAGGDCDSIASMAAQCWGALHGEGRLPQAELARIPPFVRAGVERMGAFFSR